jgi:hypothetical protein
VREEIEGLQMNLHDFCGHDGKVFNAWVVCQPKSVPYHNIIIAYYIWLVLCPGLNTPAPQGLICEITGWKELAIFVFRDPKGMFCKLGSAPVPTSGLS